MHLRPYQEEARQAVWANWNEGKQKTLLVLPTGTGKTVVFSKIVEDSVKREERCLILAHRDELLQQAGEKLQAVTGLIPALQAQGTLQGDPGSPVTIGSVQSFARDSRLQGYPQDYFDTIIVDEAHHALSPSYLKILHHFGESKVLGVTATPDRGDRRNLGLYFQSIAYEYTLPKAIESGYLCPIKARTLPLSLDLSGVSVQAGEFKGREVHEALWPFLEQISLSMQTHCRGRKTVVFLPLIETSRHFCALLREKGFRAEEVNGHSEDRRDILARFARGEIDVLCNAMLLTEGWDCPSVDCIVVLRPTRSRALYAQMVGRGTRPAPGKADLLLLDFLWHTDRHALIRPAHLVAKEQKVAEKMTARLEEGDTLELIELEEQASRDIVAEREASLAKELEAQRNKTSRLVDILQYETSLCDEDLVNYTPIFAVESLPASQRQKDLLQAFGINPEGVECAGKASLLISRLTQRRSMGLTTPKQIRLLERYGFRHVGLWKKEEASAVIEIISQNRWKVPPRMNAYTYTPDSLATKRYT